MARGQDLAHSCMGGQPFGMLVPHQESPNYDRICPPFKMPWAVQQEVVGRSLFEGLSGHFWEGQRLPWGSGLFPYVFPISTWMVTGMGNPSQCC